MGDATGNTSAGHLLGLIRDRDDWTRQRLLAATGISRTTLVERLDSLATLGLVYEAGSLPSTGGRPARVIRFDDRGRVVLAFDIGHTHAHVTVADIYGGALRAERHRVRVAEPPGKVMGTLTRIADRLLRAGAGERLVATGVSVPGAIAPATGQLLATPIMPGWDRYPVRDRLVTRYGVPVVLENDARALALGEATVHADANPVVAVKYASGIGAGIVEVDTVLRGADGYAGDIGHVRVGHRRGPRCPCGRQGCLAAYASGQALLRRLRSARVRTLDDVARLAAAKDPAVTPTLTEAATLIGQVLATVVTTVNPKVLVLGGILGRLPLVVRAVDRKVRTDALDRATRTLRVVPSQLEEHAVSAGLVRIAAARVYGPDAVDRAVAAAR